MGDFIDYGPELAAALGFFVLGMLGKILHVGWWLPEVKKRNVPSLRSKQGIMTAAGAALSLGWLGFSLVTGIIAGAVTRWCGRGRAFKLPGWVHKTPAGKFRRGFYSGLSAATSAKCSGDLR